MSNEHHLSSIQGFIQSIPAFENLPEDVLRHLAKNCRIDYAARGARLWVQDQTMVEDICLVVSGAVELYDETAEDQRQDLLEKGQMFGGLSLLRNKGVAVRSARTIEDTFLYRIDAAVFFEVFKNNQDLRDYFNSRLQSRYQRSLKALRQRRSSMRSGDEPALLHLRVTDVMEREICRCLPDTSLREAAQIINLNDSGYILIKENNRLLGIVTDRDLRREVVSGNMSADQPIRELMNSPVFTVKATSTVLDALLTMAHKGISHVPALDEDDQVVGLINAMALPQVRGRSPLSLVHQIRNAKLPEELNTVQKQLPSVVQGLFQEGYAPEHIVAYVAHVNDAVLDTMIHFALQRLGPPPRAFAFIVLGSEGREEQTLSIDQDNGIVYDDAVDDQDSDAEAATYFANLGALVCTWLDQAGVRYCNGKIMANNPAWCQPISKWLSNFKGWIDNHEPKDLMHANIFFDFRMVHGEARLEHSLRDHLFVYMKDRGDGFFSAMARHLLIDPPPLGFFRNFIVEAKGKNKNTLDIKSVMNMVVGFARLLSLQEGIRDTNTLRRLDALGAAEILEPDELASVRRAYTYMYDLRLHHQLEVLDKPDNNINPYSLSKVDQDILRAVFAQVAALQKRIRRRFFAAI